MRRPVASLSVWLLAACAAGVSLSAAAQKSKPPSQVADLVTGRPIGGALVVVTRSHRPFFGSLFASADPMRCIHIGFVRTDAAGRLPADNSSYPQAVLAPGVARIAATTLSPRQSDGQYVLITERLQSSKNAERFGPGYATEAEANAAREAFLRSPEGREYTAFTVKPYGETEFQNFRMLEVKNVEVARSQRRYPSEAAADAASREATWTLAGPTDAAQLREALAFCHDAKLDGKELAAPVLDAIAADRATASETDTQALLAHWRQRVRK